ncbi:MAG TPA: hypothetical protein VGB63_10230 [Pedobacter sp.]|jgi:hypothetical protein
MKKILFTAIIAGLSFFALESNAQTSRDEQGEYRYETRQERVWVPERRTGGIFGVGGRTIPGHYEVQDRQVKVYRDRDGNPINRDERYGEKRKGWEGKHPHGMPPGQRKKGNRQNTDIRDRGYDRNNDGVIDERDRRYDRNNDGVIDERDRRYDRNNDGVIDERDRRYDRDRNSDGVIDERDRSRGRNRNDNDRDKKYKDRDDDRDRDRDDDDRYDDDRNKGHQNKNKKSKGKKG